MRREVLKEFTAAGLDYIIESLRPASSDEVKTDVLEFLLDRGYIDYKDLAALFLFEELETEEDEV